MTLKPLSLLVVMLAAAAGAACADRAPASATEPAWLRAKITQFEQLPVGNPPRSILRTTYAGRTVYFVTPTCCDIPSELYEASGQLICFPGGGFAGGDGRCPGFALPPDATVVWRDARTTAQQPESTPARK
jgi:hypothetical protein